MKLFIVTAGWDYEGTCAQWAFTDEAAARAKFDGVAVALRAGDERGDYVTLRGPFALGEDMCDYFDAEKLLARCDPDREAEEARQKAYNEKRRAARRVAKASGA